MEPRVLAKTEASGGQSLHPQVLAFSTSLQFDKTLLREDLIGSLAHLTMLARRKILPAGDSKTLKGGLLALWNEAKAGTLQLPEEEDVHMAVEAELSKRLGDPAGLLHSARSRNDQVALDLRLHVREQLATALDSTSQWLAELVERARSEKDVLLPSYTHRQRAQPISAAYFLAAYGAMFARDLDAFSFALSQVDALPLGVGAISGTSLPTDRSITQSLLRFSKLTLNGMDTVGDRDFALDYTYAATRFMLHASRLSTDMIDFASPEFGFIKLDGEIACGSSMMPQKRNPDVFELVRGKSGRAVGNLVSLLTMVKGLPGGYNRDLQEDRTSILETGPMLNGVLGILRLALPRVQFNGERMWNALEGDYTQATDLAEAFVKRGLPFRQSYKLVGALVRKLQEKGLPMSKATLAIAKEVDPRFDEELLASLELKGAVARKESAGGTGPESVRRQLEALAERAQAGKAEAAKVPRLEGLFADLEKASLEG